MRDGFRYRAAAFFAAHLLVAMPSSSRVGVITFADKVVVQTKQLQDPQAVMGLLREIAAADLGLARGATSLLDAIVAAVHLLGPPRPGDVIYAITDGDDTASQSRKAEVEKLLISAGIRFYATLLYEESAPGYFSETTVSEISKLTEATGGTSQRFEITENIWSGDTKGLSEKGLKRVRDSADFLAKQFAHYYSVDLELPEEVDKPRKLELELVPDSKLQTKGLKLFYPTKLLPCSLRTESRP